MANKLILSSVVAMLVAGGIYLAVGNSGGVSVSAPNPVTQATAPSAGGSSGSATEDAGVPAEKQAMLGKGVPGTEEQGATQGMLEVKNVSPGGYVSYTPGVALTAAQSGKVVLFFHASWCPTCRALDLDIRANAVSIPEGLVILDVDYDRETALKQRYGVTYQHTLVEVDASGDLIKKWSGGQTLASLVAQVQ